MSDHIKCKKIKDGNKPAIFFIPDMTGFTKFIKKADLREGSEFLHDLLEVIIDSNMLRFKVAEIQGDAILFYKLCDPLSYREIEQQAKKTFLDFQETLAKLEAEHPRLKGVRKLTLKIIVHYGMVSTMKIKGNLKLIGTDTVIAHRLMKNNIKDKEYLLLSESYCKTQSADPKEIFDWSVIHTGKMHYDHLGEVKYRYLSLSPLRERIPVDFS